MKFDRNEQDCQCYSNYGIQSQASIDVRKGGIEGRARKSGC